MKITKYEHACLVIEEAGKKLIIDPGVFSPSYTDYSNVTAVVVTHVHPDHLDAEKLKAIHSENPDVQIYTVRTVADELKDSLPLVIVSEGQMIGIKPFELEFFGTNHALIHKTVPITKNTGVMVNNLLYYPGDALTLPHKPVEFLAVPASGPWLKVSDAMDFITAIKPKQAFPTHNAILSKIGQGIQDLWLKAASDAVGTSYNSLQPGEVVHI